MASTMVVIVLLIGLACFTQGSPIGDFIKNRLPGDPSTQLLKTKFELEFYGNYKLKSYYSGLLEESNIYDAEKFCQKIGMDLVSIGSDQERIFLHENARPNQRYWTSGTIKNVGYWKSSGKEFTVSVVDYNGSFEYPIVFTSGSTTDKNYDNDLKKEIGIASALPLCQI